MIRLHSQTQKTNQEKKKKKAEIIQRKLNTSSLTSNMESHQLASFAATFLKKFSGQERLPAAAVLDGNSSESEQFCAICLNDICGGDSDSYRKLPECRHSFHSKCIDVWLRSHSTCPLCRAQLPQIISLDQNHYDWNHLVSNVLLLLQDFLHKMCNPLNHELSSMLCGNISCNIS